MTSKSLRVDWAGRKSLIPAYDVGSIFGGCEILALVTECDSMHGRVYAVRYLCCGGRAEHTHAVLQARERRVRSGPVLCRACNARRNGQYRKVMQGRVVLPFEPVVLSQQPEEASIEWYLRASGWERLTRHWERLVFKSGGRS